MTDYPTRAEIDAAANTIEWLQNCVDRGVPAWGVTWSGLETAREILTHLDAVPGVLHYPEPEPEPKPTAAEVLFQASTRQNDNSPEGSILWAAHRYAKDHPEWFVNWHMYESAGGALGNAAFFAGGRGSDPVAQAALNAASQVAKAHPELFGGAA